VLEGIIRSKQMPSYVYRLKCHDGSGVGSEMLESYDSYWWIEIGSSMAGFKCEKRQGFPTKEFQKYSLTVDGASLRELGEQSYVTASMIREFQDFVRRD